ncbi:MAG TPA: dihydrofolate reductase [Clostridiales bacterium]|nr:dihydrofolate reductase [Clostridiales bacterium]
MNLIVAVDKKWAIGYKGDLLVKIPSDQKFFRLQTTNKAVIMGRKTLESMPASQPLPNRLNVVITKQKDYKIKDAIVVNSIEEALDAVKEYKSEDIFVIGGETIYKQMLDKCTVAHVTKIDYEYNADTFFPNLDKASDWELVASSEEQTYHDLEYVFNEYHRKK